jgi:hypothetical protein
MKPDIFGTGKPTDPSPTHALPTRRNPQEERKNYQENTSREWGVEVRLLEASREPVLMGSSAQALFPGVVGTPKAPTRIRRRHAERRIWKRSGANEMN